jgi:protein-tyrosine phosphatase
MHGVFPGLYLASWSQVQQATGQWYVVNCTRDLPMVARDGLRIAVDDDLSPEALGSFLEALPDTVEKIHEQLSRGQQVVVHCHLGQQRSPAVVAAYLMAYYGMPLAESMAFVRERKADAFFWKANFLPALEAFEAHLNRIRSNVP